MTLELCLPLSLARLALSLQKDTTGSFWTHPWASIRERLRNRLAVIGIFHGRNGIRRAVPAIEAVKERARDVPASVLSFEVISNLVHNDMSQMRTIVTQVDPELAVFVRIPSRQY